MTQYELAVILHPDLEIDLQKPLKKIENQITELEGKVISRDDWGKRKLAYPIKKQSFGVYFIYLLELPPTALNRLEKTLNITDEVIRHLIVKYVEPPVHEEKEEKEAAKTDESEDKPAKKVVKPTNPDDSVGAPNPRNSKASEKSAKVKEKGEE